MFFFCADLYQQIAPISFASVSSKIDDLVRREIAFPAFKNSIFTTTEISFGDAPAPIHKNTEVAFDTFEAVTVVGAWDHERGGGILFPEDESVIQLKPGATVLFPAGTKRFTFVAIAPHEKRYFFRQFCHGGVLRWLEKGGRSDTEFEDLASAAEIASWNERRARRGEMSLKMFSKLGDIFVF
ncbi:hypothetical protein B0H13DRAFT_1659025 [Mycena leptocephala]|nr:hypothetical protein B0H13DRAFT_1659025 [Mycena leptocephala]